MGTLVLISSVSHMSSFSNKRTPLPIYAQEGAPSFAVAELFTAEGCSTCPQADKFTSELYRAYHAQNQPVYVLAFHVDYWDEYGWTDNFGRAEFSKRQRKYGSLFKLESVYTPQLIINGAEEMVGSDPNARTSIDAALQKPASVIVNIEPVFDADKKKITVHYTLSRVPANCVLNIAIVERGLVREIWRGENSGRTLTHDNVVRSFKTVKKPSADGYSTVELPADIHTDNSSIVAFLQDSDSLRILGAAGADLK